MRLIKLHLENYCNYEHYTFDFRHPDGNPYKYICFFGPNGIGKSTILEAISLLTANQSGRDPANVRRSLYKYVRNKDYDPSYHKISGHSYEDNFSVGSTSNASSMIIEGTYEMDGKPYIVRLTQDGFERNDLAPSSNSEGPWGDEHLLYRQRISHFITSDSDLSMSKFQLRKEQIPAFEAITSKVMRYSTQCLEPSGILPMDEDYCTDFIILKKGHRPLWMDGPHCCYLII
jgi:AAA15 family ATPase/GTPase